MQIDPSLKNFVVFAIIARLMAIVGKQALPLAVTVARADIPQSVTDNLYCHFNLYLGRK